VLGHCDGILPSIRLDRQVNLDQALRIAIDSKNPSTEALPMDRNPACSPGGGCAFLERGDPGLHCRGVGAARRSKPPVPSCGQGPPAAADLVDGNSRLVLAVEGGGQPGGSDGAHRQLRLPAHRADSVPPNTDTAECFLAHSATVAGVFSQLLQPLRRLASATASALSSASAPRPCRRGACGLEG